MGTFQISFGDVHGAPYLLNWTLNSPRNVEETWAAFSDTDRFTRVVGWVIEWKNVYRMTGKSCGWVACVNWA